MECLTHFKEDNLIISQLRLGNNDDSQVKSPYKISSLLLFKRSFSTQLNDEHLLIEVTPLSHLKKGIFNTSNSYVKELDYHMIDAQQRIKILPCRFMRKERSLDLNVL